MKRLRLSTPVYTVTQLLRYSLVNTEDGSMPLLRILKNIVKLTVPGLTAYNAARPEISKISGWVWKGVYTKGFGRSHQLSLNKFIDPSTPSMGKGRDGEKNRGKRGKKRGKIKGKKRKDG